MQSVYKLVSTFNQFYREINPATLSGAIDVIVIERPDGELACSPFHVRFGKLSVLRPQEKKVEITVNGQLIDFPMKVGEAGEAFFIIEMDNEVPHELQTSPLAGPTQPAPHEEEPDFFDLGESSIRPTTYPFMDRERVFPQSSDVNNSDLGTEDGYDGDNERKVLVAEPENLSLLESIVGRDAVENLTKPDEPNLTKDIPSNDVPLKTQYVFPDFQNSLLEKTGINGEGITDHEEQLAESANGYETMSSVNNTDKLESKPIKPVSVESTEATEGPIEDHKQERDNDHDDEKEIERMSLKQTNRSGISPDNLLEGELDSTFAQVKDRQFQNELFNEDSLKYGGESQQKSDKHNSLLDEINPRSYLGEVNSWPEQQSLDYSISEPQLANESKKKNNNNPLIVEAQGNIFCNKNAIDDKDPGLSSDTDYNSNQSYTHVSANSLENFVIDQRTQETITTRLQFERTSSLPHEFPLWEKPEGPFSDTELEETRKPENLNERHPIRVSPLSDTELEYEPKKPSAYPQEWSWRWGALPVRNSEKIEQWRDGPKEKEWKENDSNQQDETSGLEVDGKSYRIAMSLCGIETFGSDETVNEERFRKNEITYEHFCENPHILSEKALVFKYKDRYYNWATAAPIIVSLLAFQKPLPESAISSLTTTQLEALPKSDRRRYSFGRGWSRWFRSSGSHNAIDDAAKVSEERNTLDLGKTSKSQKETPQQQQQQASVKHPKNYAKSLRLTSEQLKKLNLKKGVNTISFSVASSYQGKATCVAKLFFWDYNTQIVISDIDGTITKSDALGHVFTMIGKDWTHSGVAKLYSDIQNNGYQILYLTSRAIGQADYTRDYLRKVEQNKYQLPDGPVIMSPDRLLTAFHREIIIRKPEVFKMACLRDVRKLFDDRNPFFAGFGNRITDALSYRSVDVPPSRIFTIDSNGTVKLELLSGYKSSYIDLSDLVDQMFPHIGAKKWDTEYNEWNYWKSPLPKIEIPPEIYATNLSTVTPSSPGSQPASSPRLGMIRSLTGSITRGDGKPRQPIPTFSAPASLERVSILSSPRNSDLNGLIVVNESKSDTIENGIINGYSKKRSRRLHHNPYIKGNLDMPGSMDITLDKGNNNQDEKYRYEEEDGDDEGSEGESEQVQDNDINEDEEEESEFDEDIPGDIKFDGMPY
ncbi:hypothetical protein G9A89_022981 [Geosiphon pyriformis]|nr:hypothetical protein G9A89_022981 [Geosiphon pyriformis]